MTPLHLSSLLALPLLVRHAAALHVDAPGRKGGRGPEWVEEAIRNKARADWINLNGKCQGQSMAAMPHDAPSEVEPVAIQGPLTEFSDLSPSEMAWVEAQYQAQAGESFASAPPNTSDAAAPPAHGGGGAQELPFTTGECKPAHGGHVPGLPQLHTCRFQNVYAVRGGLVAHVLAHGEFPDGNTTIYTQAGPNWRALSFELRVVRHESRGAFQAYMGGGPYARLDGATLAFEPKWHFNIGHALYDGLYPAFVSLVQWGLDQTPFRVLKLGPPNNGVVEWKVPGAMARNEEVYGLIGGKGIVSQHLLREGTQDVLFETLVIGMGRNSQKIDMNSNFSLGGGRDLGAARLLRSHAYKSLDIPARTGRSERLLEGIIIDNRRWGWKGWVEPVRTKAADAGVKLEFIDWGKAPDSIRDPKANGGNNPSPTNGQFRGQLLTISRTYIHISSPGTGMMYQQFLPDGAVHINLGESGGPRRWFMEEYMAEGAPYIRALYYWPARGGPQDYDPDRIMALVLQAKELVQGGFEIPVPVNTNLSPTMRVVKAFAYQTQDREKLASMTPLWLIGSAKTPSYDTNYFGNHFPHEYLQMPTPTGRVLNPCMLRALTQDYGEPCDKCEWGFP